jgi:glucosylceramidase
MMCLCNKELVGLAVAIVLLSGMAGCKEKTTENPGPVETGSAQVWLTNGSKVKLLIREADLVIRDSLVTSLPVIRIDTTLVFQEIEGFGAALTGSSAYLINQKLSETKRESLLLNLFDPQSGIGISYLRLTMGASDFSLSDFTYNDLPSGETDFDLEQFSLAQDLDDVVPVMKEILQVAPAIKLMGSPWSPPAWMKNNGNLVGGKLKTECYAVYANYFVRYVNAMKDQGIVIDAVTPQNEPLHFTAAYPCMEMQPEEQSVFIKDHLGPAFVTAGLQTKIITYDHNWDRPDYGISILNDAQAKAFVAGTAFHAYAGSYSAMSTVHNAHPDRGVYFTEISGGEWATNFSDNLMWYMENILIGTTKNWSKNALFWNLALDHGHGPQNSGCSDCRGVVTIDESTGLITKNEEYYALGHFAKFVRPGALRVSNTTPQTLSNMGIVAFLNNDGSKVLILCNYTDQSISFAVEQGSKKFTYALPQKSAATIVWY